MERRISFSRGKGKLRHNNRDIISSNVDKDRIKDNVIIKQQSLGEAYEEIFGEARKAYNTKQKRKDRQIDNYFEKLFGKEPTDTILTNSNKQQSFYEHVVGIGDMFDTSLVDKILKDGTEVKANPKAAKTATECLKEYADGFQKRNPNFYVFNAVIHLDETTPHLHLDSIPFADGYKKGMTRQQGIAKALEAMGYGKGEDAVKRFTEAERNVLRKICESHGIAIAKEEKGRGQDIATQIYGEVKDNQRELDKVIQEINDKEIKKNTLENEISELERKKELTELENVSIKESIEALTETRDKTALQLVSDFVTGKGRDKVETAEKIIENETVLKDAMRRENEERFLELERRESILKYKETKADEKIKEINKQIVVNNKNTAILKSGWAKLQMTVEQETQKRLSAKTFRASHANEDERYKQRCKLNFDKEYEQEINKSSERIQQTHEKIERLKHHTSKRKQKGVCLE